MVRQQTYEAAESVWARRGYPGGYAVVLAGPEAHEVRLLRDYLRWAPSRTLFVDRDPRGLAVVHRDWPAAQTFHGWLHDGVARIDKIGFLNLDLMGGFNNNTIKAVEACRARLLPDAVVAYTFVCARENDSTLSCRRMRAAATNTESRDAERFSGYARLLRRTLGKLLLVKSIKYQTTLMPMGVLVFRVP